MKRFLPVFAIMAVLLGAVGMAQAVNPFAISLERVDGLKSPGTDTVLTGVTIRWIIRVQNDSTPSFNFSNGFRVYSPNGATWDSTRGDTLGRIPGPPVHAIFGKAYFDIQYAVNSFSADGLLSDTIGFIAAKIASQGLYPGLNDTVWGVYAYNISTASHKDSICIDSAWFRPGGTWKWAASGGVNRFPSWDGPHCYLIWNPAADVRSVDDGLPKTFTLSQNYPNPFNPNTIIKFDIPVNSKVNLTVYNVLGQRVKTLVDQDLTAKHYEVDWDGTSDAGVKVASGIYFYKIEAGNFIQTKKMVMLK
ncbi:MAG TPA: T9SS type A sorting domain-containing protein [Candidatus Acidoferrum sp.]|nr:T9SS type A sorting domain-containing protein [Candidatus Acidoferrum sp.]